MRPALALALVVAGLVPLPAVAQGSACPAGRTLSGGCLKPEIMDRLTEASVARTSGALSDTGPVTLLSSEARLRAGILDSAPPRAVRNGTSIIPFQNELGVK